MEIVQPIRDKSKVNEIKEILKRGSYRDYLMFVVGINSGLRVSDLLRLRVSDVRDKTHIIIKEKKTGKYKRHLINKSVQESLQEYIKNKDDEEFLFKSREGNNKAISKMQAYRIINGASRRAGIKDQIGTHTLRKTFGYHHYQQFKDVALLQDIFNHSAPIVTLRYIGINDDIKDESIALLEI